MEELSVYIIAILLSNFCWKEKQTKLIIYKRLFLQCILYMVLHTIMYHVPYNTHILCITLFFSVYTCSSSNFDVIKDGMECKDATSKGTGDKSILSTSISSSSCILLRCCFGIMSKIEKL